MRRFTPLSVIFGLLAAALVAAVVARPWVVSAGSPLQRRLVVETNLAISPGQQIATQPVALDGFAVWSYEVSHLGAPPQGLDWRAVYRFRNDLEWSGCDAQFTSIPFMSQLVCGPEGAVFFRNNGANTVHVAVSAVLIGRSFFDKSYGIAATQTTVAASSIQVAPGQDAFSEEFNLGTANAASYQLHFVTGPGRSSVVADTEWRIFPQQNFVTLNGSGLTQERHATAAQAVLAPRVRLKIHNAGPDFVEVRPAVYAITTN